MSARVGLHALTAPAYWTRWAVSVDGKVVGAAEKKGMSSSWYAYPANNGPMTMHRTRKDAVAKLTERTT